MGTVGWNVRAVAVFTLAVSVCCSGSAYAQRRPARCVAPAEDYSRPVELTPVEQDIFNRTNDYRAQNGLPRVALNPQLTRAARYFANWMAITGQFDHDADGKGPGVRATKFGYNWSLVCENIAYRYTCDSSLRDLATDFVTGWIQSAGHRKNMLCDEVIESGVGVAVGKDPRRQYSVQLYGKPRGQLYTFSIVNDSKNPVRYVLGRQVFTLRPGHTRIHPDSESYPDVLREPRERPAPAPDGQAERVRVEVPDRPRSRGARVGAHCATLTASPEVAACSRWRRRNRHAASSQRRATGIPTPSGRRPPSPTAAPDVPTVATSAKLHEPHGRHVAAAPDERVDRVLRLVLLLARHDGEQRLARGRREPVGDRALRDRRAPRSRRGGKCAPAVRNPST